uniref:Uncharacterized protein n=1 Tax=Steinernema glaseri TaxID=37863 RepID=A0A1I7YJN3_9BILA
MFALMNRRSREEGHHGTHRFLYRKWSRSPTTPPDSNRRTYFNVEAMFALMNRRSREEGRHGTQRFSHPKWSRSPTTPPDSNRR